MQPGSFFEQASWFDFKNDNAATAPAFGVMRLKDIVVGSADELVYRKMDQPDNSSQGKCYVNGPVDVAAAAYGRCSRGEEVLALYDSADGVPAFGQYWGAQSGTWKLKKGMGGFYCLGAPTNSNLSIALFEPPRTRSLLVNKATHTLWANSGTFTIFSGTQGSESAESGTISAYVRRGFAFASSIYEARQMVNGWEIVNPSLMIRGKFAADLAPDVSATMTLWLGTNGAEASGITTVSGVWNASGCTILGSKMVTANWCEDNSSFHVMTGKT